MQEKAKATHTMGPWRIKCPSASTFEDTIAIMGGETGEAQICAVYPMGDDDEIGTKECSEHDESVANSCLIVAAPDLLEVCRNFVESVSENGEFNTHTAEMSLIELRELAVQAIQIADGEA